MLADHARKDISRLQQTGNGEAVVTRDGGLLVGHPHRFHGNHRLKVWPLLQRRQGRHGRPEPVRHRAVQYAAVGLTSTDTLPRGPDEFADDSPCPCVTTEDSEAKHCCRCSWRYGSHKILESKMSQGRFRSQQFIDKVAEDHPFSVWIAGRGHCQRSHRPL